MTLPSYPSQISLCDVYKAFNVLGNAPSFETSLYNFRAVSPGAPPSGAVGYPHGVSTSIPSSGMISLDSFHGVEPSSVEYVPSYSGAWNYIGELPNVACWVLFQLIGGGGGGGSGSTVFYGGAGGAGAYAIGLAQLPPGTKSLYAFIGQGGSGAAVGAGAIGGKGGGFSAGSPVIQYGGRGGDKGPFVGGSGGGGGGATALYMIFNNGGANITVPIAFAGGGGGGGGGGFGFNGYTWADGTSANYGGSGNSGHNVVNQSLGSLVASPTTSAGSDGQGYLSNPYSGTVYGGSGGGGGGSGLNGTLMTSGGTILNQSPGGGGGAGKILYNSTYVISAWQYLNSHTSSSTTEPSITAGTGGAAGGGDVSTINGTNGGGNGTNGGFSYSWTKSTNWADCPSPMII